MKVHNFFIIVFFAFIGCQSKSNDNEKTTNLSMRNNFINDSIQERNKNSELYDFLYQDIMHKSEGTIDGINITENYFRVESSLILSHLKRVGYKFLSKEEYFSKLKKVFKYKKIDDRAEILCLRSNSDNCDFYIKNSIYNFQIGEGLEQLEYYSLIESSFITHNIRLAKLVDYRREFPNLAKIEDNEIIKDRDKGEDGYSYWKDFSTLFNSQRDLLYKKIEYQNKYLFNDSKASLTWLMSNSKYFLNDLVKNFGYVEDKDLLKWVIDETPIQEIRRWDNIDDYAKLFYIMTCDKKLVLHQETMDMMVSYNREKHFNDIKELLIGLQINMISLEGSTFEQKAHFFAYLFEIVRRTGGKTYNAQVLLGSFNSNTSEDYGAEFKKNNFYGYCELEEYWESSLDI